MKYCKKTNKCRHQCCSSITRRSTSGDINTAFSDTFHTNYSEIHCINVSKITDFVTKIIPSLISVEKESCRFWRILLDNGISDCSIVSTSILKDILFKTIKVGLYLHILINLNNQATQRYITVLWRIKQLLSLWDHIRMPVVN